MKYYVQGKGGNVPRRKFQSLDMERKRMNSFDDAQEKQKTKKLDVARTSIHTRKDHEDAGTWKGRDGTWKGRGPMGNGSSQTEGQRVDSSHAAGRTEEHHDKIKS